MELINKSKGNLRSSIYLHFEMLSGSVLSLLVDTSRIFRLDSNPTVSGRETKALDARRSSSRCSSAPIPSGITYKHSKSTDKLGNNSTIL